MVADVDGTVEKLPVGRRPWWSRASAAQIFMVVAGILAFIANLAILRAREDVVLVAVAASDINAGVAVDEAVHVEYVELNGSDAVLAPLVTSEEFATLSGSVLSSPMEAGDMFVQSELVASVNPLEQRAIALAVGRDHAVGGDITVGDRVDVIWVDDGAAEYIVTGVEVIDTSSSERSGGAFSGSQAFSLTVSVDDVQALRLAEALNSGQIEIVRSTGAGPPTADTL
ncbi:MAG TPA: RcpC/CpaB family pilus assembly protein, partial [Acidimicrobiia bacterium]